MKTGSYHTYTRSRDASWQFLIDNNITALPLAFHDVCTANNIKLYRYIGESYFKSNERGVAFKEGSRFNIFVNGTDELQVQRYTIAHEMGHIFLGHITGDKVHARISGLKPALSGSSEYQAERFAAGILAPACVLWGLGIHSAKDIAELCIIPLEEARRRAARMRELYKRDAFLKSPLEKKVFEQFESFITEMKSSREFGKK